jgi:uncharacterized membrane protein YcaP (DUF421 family)
MDLLVHLDWRTLLIPTVSVAEIIFRGTVMYLLLLGGLRILRRETDVIGVADLLVVVLIADAAQNAMSREYKSVTEGAILVATIFGWDYLLDWAGYRFPRVQRFLRPAPLLLVRDGRLLRWNLQRELITEGELMSQLRLQGIDDVTQVQKAYLEGDGRISVIVRDSPQANAPDTGPRVP